MWGTQWPFVLSPVLNYLRDGEHSCSINLKVLIITTPTSVSLLKGILLVYLNLALLHCLFDC